MSHAPSVDPEGYFGPESSAAVLATSPDHQRAAVEPGPREPVAADPARERTVHEYGIGRLRTRATPDDARPAPSPVLVDSLTHLRATVTTYVDGRRNAAVPVQRVLPEVKALVREALSDDASRAAVEALLPQVVRWSIEAYFARDYARGDYAVRDSAAQPGDVRDAAPC